MDIQVQQAYDQSMYGKMQRQASKSPSELEKATTDFEAFFIYTMLENMQEGIEVDENFGGGHAETVFKSMLNEHLATEMAQKSPFGIADAVQAELLKLQEVKGD